MFIAAFVRDGFVRPFLGDVLAVVWLHLLGRAVFLRAPGWTAAGALAVAYLVELGQWFGLVDVLGLGGSRVARVVLGATFDPLDLLAYTLGAASAWAGEAAVRRRAVARG